MKSPNNALQPTRLRVTACAPNHHHLSAHRHRPRHSGVWLSLGALGAFHASSEKCRLHPFRLPKHALKRNVTPMATFMF